VHRRRYTLEFDPHRDGSVSGRVLAEGRPEGHFAGWLDLMVLLQAAHAADPEGRAPHAADAGPADDS
jgi:hypothetical protein